MFKIGDKVKVTKPSWESEGIVEQLSFRPNGTYGVRLTHLFTKIAGPHYKLGYLARWFEKDMELITPHLEKSDRICIKGAPNLIGIVYDVEKEVDNIYFHLPNSSTMHYVPNSWVEKLPEPKKEISISELKNMLEKEYGDRATTHWILERLKEEGYEV